MAHPRLDEWLVSEGHYSTRARAREAILRGCVLMAGDHTVKPSRRVVDPSAITVSDPAARFVSRAALKLEAALAETGLSPQGRVALDLGASTGGFCQILLERGAERVYAVDVGHGQMDPRISGDARLVNIEGLNARDLETKHLEGNRPQFITCDVSFISLKLALPAALALAADDAVGIFLVKPQFEVGKEALGKGGIVRDDLLARETAEALSHWLGSVEDWSNTHIIPSPVKGGDGNTEYLLTGKKHG
ncbi:MAG: TlyA family RNA methyltransferase [Pseudomonadota bacterium]